MGGLGKLMSAGFGLGIRNQFNSNWLALLYPGDLC